jgi:hypothetical protein
VLKKTGTVSESFDGKVIFIIQLFIQNYDFATFEDSDTDFKLGEEVKK